MPGKPRFEHANPVGDICIIRWQAPDHVDRCGQNCDRVYPETMMAQGTAHRAAQLANAAEQQITARIGEAEREKEAFGIKEGRRQILHGVQATRITVNTWLTQNGSAEIGGRVPEPPLVRARPAAIHPCKCGQRGHNILITTLCA